MASGSAYRLSVAPELSAYLPEIDYVCALLEQSHGLVRDDAAARAIHYGPNPPAGADAVPAILFAGGSRIADDGLHPDRAAIDRLATGLMPRDDARAFDAIGLAFLLISRLEERDAATGDRYGRYPHALDFQVRHGLFGRAAADEALAALAKLITGRDDPAGITQYRLQPTHDVDRLRAYHHITDPLRLAAGDILKRGRPVQGLQRLRSFASDEPWASVQDILGLSETLGLTSRFYFMGPSLLPQDSPYAATMPALLRRVAGHVAGRGHGIGFHPGYRTASDPDLWQRQRSGLEAVIGRPVSDGRQHMLGYDVAITPDIWDQAGMQADYTLAYPEAEGFRTGSTRLLPAYSLRSRRRLQLRQGSTAIMDFGLFGGKYRDLPVEAALELCRPVIRTARRFGGTLTVLFHTGQPAGPARDFYHALLREAA